jgi:hypothetical protein
VFSNDDAIGKYGLKSGFRTVEARQVGKCYRRIGSS